MQVRARVPFLLTAAVLKAEIREPPDVAQADRVRDARHGEIELTPPGPPFHGQGAGIAEGSSRRIPRDRLLRVGHDDGAGGGSGLLETDIAAAALRAASLLLQQEVDGVRE